MRKFFVFQHVTGSGASVRVFKSSLTEDIYILEIETPHMAEKARVHAKWDELLTMILGVGEALHNEAERDRVLAFGRKPLRPLTPV